MNMDKLKIAILEPKPFEDYHNPSLQREGISYTPIRYMGVGFTDHGRKTMDWLIKGLLLDLSPEEIKQDVEIYYTKNDDKGMKWCVDNGIHIVSMSTADYFHLTNTSIEEVLDDHALLFTSAGNTGRYTDVEKRKEKGAALRPSWIAVGSLEYDLTPEDYSSYGAGKVMFADFDGPDNDEGTSYATPYTAAKGAIYYYRYAKYHGKFPQREEAIEWAIRNAQDVHLPGKDDKTGYGQIVLPDQWTFSSEVRDPKYWMVHHSATADNPNGDNYQGIYNYHVYTLGYRDIGYDWVIEREGGKVVTKKGRSETGPGAHCNDNSMNTVALSVCVIGNFDETEMDQELIDAVKDIKADREKVWGRTLEWRLHRDDTPKTCPGMNVTVDTFMEPVDDDLHDWGREAWYKAVDKGINDGQGSQDYVTEEQLMVFFDRLGLLD